MRLNAGRLDTAMSVRHKSEKNGGSGSPVLLPVIFEPPIDAAAAQGDDGVSAANGPEHAGSFQARSDDRLIARFDHAGAKEESL